MNDAQRQALIEKLVPVIHKAELTPVHRNGKPERAINVAAALIDGPLEPVIEALAAAQAFHERDIYGDLETDEQVRAYASDFATKKQAVDDALAALDPAWLGAP